VIGQWTFGVRGVEMQRGWRWLEELILWRRRWVVIGNVILWRIWWRLMVRDVVVWWRWRVGIDMMMHLVEWRLLPLFLLAKDVNAVL
jgi:hypothetical protein